MEGGKENYYEFDVPEEGLTLKIDVIEGFVVVYVSTSISNPNAAYYDYKLVTNTTIDIFITNEKRKRRQTGTDPPTDPPTDKALKVYLTIEGISPLNHFVLDTTFNDTSTPTSGLCT